MVLTCAEQTTYRHSHVGSAGSPTVIVSGGDTNIKGAQVTGKGITVRATNFNIESLQDTADYRSRQQNISAQVTVGYGASASGDYPNPCKRQCCEGGQDSGYGIGSEESFGK